MMYKGLICSISVIFLVVLFLGCVENTDNTVLHTGTWLDEYTPVHSVGEGADDFWVEFPETSDMSGQEMDHLSWVLDSLDDNCVCFVVHKTGCASCTPQAERVISIAGSYKEYVEFFDLDIPLGGDVEKKAYEAYLYDSNGPPGYIAFTAVFTVIEVDGVSSIAWHSWEGDVADDAMEDWVRDAIYYYQVYAGGR